MNKEHFDQLVKGVQEMKRHMAGKKVKGIKETQVGDPDVCSIREAAHLNQIDFAHLIGVNVRTLQNWEQRRTSPAGPAKALLKIVAHYPAAIQCLHGGGHA